MNILSIKTDNPQAGLALYKDNQLLYEISWQADRQLAETIHMKIKELLNKSSISLNDIDGIVLFKGPGSFTGLRIGFSVGNALAYSQSIPVVAAGGKDWETQGLKDILSGHDHKIALPEYGAPPKITQPRK